MLVALQQRLRELAQDLGADVRALLKRVLPAGGTAGQVLGKTAAADFAVGWVAAGGAANLPFIDIRDHGATTAAANNQAAIQAAINAAETAGGGRVFIPPGVWNTGPLALGKRVWLEGASMRSSVLFLVNGSNADFITNKLSPDGVAGNAQFVAVRSLTLHGNRANQTAGRGIFWTQNPERGQTTGDDMSDPRMLVENVFIWQVFGDAFVNAGRSETHLHNVNVFFCGGHGFVPAPDTFLSSCKAGATARAGFFIASSSVRLVNCKVFFAGDGAATPAEGHGFHVSGSGRGVTVSNCEAQDCKAAGLRVDLSAHRTIVEGFVADSNSKRGKGLHAGVEVGASRHCIIDAVCFERNDPVVVSTDPNFCPQRYGLKLETGAINNRITITHSATSGGAVVDEPIMPSANTAALLAQNTVTINASGSYRAVAFAATITPDPYSGSVIDLGALTGNLTVAATLQMHAGLEMTLMFLQDATGGRTVAWNAQYATAWQPNPAPNARSSITLLYTGTAWIVTGALNGAGVVQVLATPGLYAVSLTAVTALTSGGSILQYLGKAEGSPTSAQVIAKVTTAYAAGNAVTPYAEVAIFKGALSPGAAASLTRVGFTSVVTTFSTVGEKVTTVALTGVNPGDELWVAFGQAAQTPFQLRALLADDLRSGVVQTYAGRPSTAALPQATVLAAAAQVPVWVDVRV